MAASHQIQLLQANIMAATHSVLDGKRRSILMSAFRADSSISAIAQVSLLDMPQFSYNLNVYGGDVTFLPGLEVWLNSLLRDTVFQPLILPEGRTIPIAPGLQNAQVCAREIRRHHAEHIPCHKLVASADAQAQCF